MESWMQNQQGFIGILFTCYFISWDSDCINKYFRNQNKTFVYGSSAISGEGLIEGVKVFAEAVKKYVEQMT